MSASYGSYGSALQATTMHSKEKTYVRYGWKYGPKKAPEGWMDGWMDGRTEKQGTCGIQHRRFFVTLLSL